MNEKPLTAMELALVRMIVDRIRRRGDALSTMARATGVSTSYLASLARQAGIRYKHQHQSTAAIARAVSLVVDDGLTVREASRQSGLSKTSVHRFVLKRRKKAVDAAGKFKFETSERGAPKPKSWRCPEHGPVTVWPCVACVALAARRK